MSVDLSKLTPAPWTTAPFKLAFNQQGDVCGSYLDINDAEFIALARNAFDILMRRQLNKGCDCCDVGGWKLWYEPVDGQWYVDVRKTVVKVADNSWQGGETVFSAADPFTALNDAETYVANVVKFGDSGGGE